MHWVLETLGSSLVPSDCIVLPCIISLALILCRLCSRECPDIDYTLEAKCSDLREIAANKRCLTLPYAEQPRLQDRQHAMQRTT